MSASKPALSTPIPRSAAMSVVTSIGKPNVSCSWKASAAGIVPPSPTRSITSSSSRVPCSSVRPKPSSSERAHSRIESRSRPSSG